MVVAPVAQARLRLPCKGLVVRPELMNAGVVIPASSSRPGTLDPSNWNTTGPNTTVPPPISPCCRAGSGSCSAAKSSPHICPTAVDTTPSYAAIQMRTLGEGSPWANRYGHSSGRMAGLSGFCAALDHHRRLQSPGGEVHWNSSPEAALAPEALPRRTALAVPPEPTSTRDCMSRTPREPSSRTASVSRTGLNRPPRPGRCSDGDSPGLQLP